MYWCVPSFVFFRSGKKSSHHFCSLLPRLGQVWGITPLVESKLLLQGREERGPCPAEKRRTLPECMNIVIASGGCCLGELSGASYSECKGIGQLPKCLQMVKTKNVVAPWPGLRNTKEARRVVPVKNNTKWSQTAAAWLIAAVLYWSQSDGGWRWWVRGREAGVTLSSCFPRWLSGAIAM